jgi:hypothetical protein
MPKPPQPFRALVLTLLLPLSAAHGAPAPALRALPPPPTQLVCAADAIHRFRVSRDAAGTPREVSVSVAAGTRECDFTSAAAPQPQPDGSWRFEWRDETLGQPQRVDVRRTGPDGYALAFAPASCGVLQIPAAATLAPAAPGCTVSVDRDGAFGQFWRQLHDALARGDGELLQQLSLPQLEFVEGSDIVKAPSSIMRGAARCLPDVPASTQRLSLREMLAADPPRLDMPPLSRKGESRIDFAGAMSLRWTAQGWRIDGFNASRSVFQHCGRP